MEVKIFMPPWALWAVLSLWPLGIWAICETSTGKHLSYRNQSLTSVPSQIPPDVILLDLSYNDIRVLLNYSLETLRHLEVLYLSNNRIQIIEPFAFHGLKELCFLSLSGNHIGKIDNNTLASLSATKLRKIILRDSGIVSITTGAFVHLKHLEHLDLSSNQDLGLKTALGSLYGLQYSYHNMTDIILRSVNSINTQFRDRVVNTTDIKHLKNICVANLDMGYNRITYIGTFFASMRYPECWRRFSLTGPQMIYVQVSWSMLFSFRHFIHLEYLDLSGNDPKVPRQKRGSAVVIADKQVTQTDISIEQNVAINSAKELSVDVLPHSLKVLNISGGVIRSTKMNTPLRFLNNGNLRVLDLSFSGFSQCLAHYLGLENLTVLNMTGFDCSQLSPNILSTLPGLQVLVVKGIRLNKGLESDPDGTFFRHQEKLTSLNMAGNGLTNLHPEIFATLRRVHSLNLGNNKFSALPRAVRSMTSLRSLDMSYNAITNLDEEDRRWLDGIWHLNRTSFLLSLYGNPFSCTCSTLDSVVWMLETDVRLELKNNLTCTLENGTQILVVKLEKCLKDMRVACVSRFWLIFSLSLTSLAAVTLCVSVVCYRYRHNIRYWFLTKCRGGAVYEETPMDECEFDAFVAYNHEDYRWACFNLREFLEDVHGYRLCLHHRDFPVGESIQGNIVDAINSSRKVILVISQKYLSCDWGEFEIQMAGMRMVQSGRDNVVIAILLDDIPVRQMPRSLIRMWKNITFLLWTKDPGDEGLFWDRLNEAMLRT